ncbi:MAG: hypothetical protein V7L11_01400 [Nostoc sp.]|uniref:hypothetical protein n=1 Tax=Nostoc sp. TaxID=1180 RepID=UPI002FF80B5C
MLHFTLSPFTTRVQKALLQEVYWLPAANSDVGSLQSAFPARNWEPEKAFSVFEEYLPNVDCLNLSFTKVKEIH